MHLEVDEANEEDDKKDLDKEKWRAVEQCEVKSHW